MNIKVIGVSGKSGTGKDYITQQFIRPLGFYQWSLAWHFKVGMVGKGLATHEEVFFTKPPHVRHELQQEGTARGRKIFGDDLWCNTAMEWFTVLNEAWGIDKFVIPDVRFQNEVAFIQRMGGQVIRINAPWRAENNSLPPELRTHVSEIDLDNFVGFDYIVNNDPEFASTIGNEVTQIINTL